MLGGQLTAPWSGPFPSFWQEPDQIVPLDLKEQYYVIYV